MSEYGIIENENHVDIPSPEDTLLGIKGQSFNQRVAAKKYEKEVKDLITRFDLSIQTLEQEDIYYLPMMGSDGEVELYPLGIRSVPEDITKRINKPVTDHTATVPRRFEPSVKETVVDYGSPKMAPYMEKFNALSAEAEYLTILYGIKMDLADGDYVAWSWDFPQKEKEKEGVDYLKRMRMGEGLRKSLAQAIEALSYRTQESIKDDFEKKSMQLSGTQPQP